MAHVGSPAASRILSRKGCSVERQFEEVISNWISISPRLSRDVQCAGKYPAPGHVLNSPSVAVGGLAQPGQAVAWSSGSAQAVDLVRPASPGASSGGISARQRLGEARVSANESCRRGFREIPQKPNVFFAPDEILAN